MLPPLLLCLRTKETPTYPSTSLQFVKLTFHLLHASLTKIDAAPCNWAWNWQEAQHARRPACVAKQHQVLLAVQELCSQFGSGSSDLSTFNHMMSTSLTSSTRKIQVFLLVCTFHGYYLQVSVPWSDFSPPSDNWSHQNNCKILFQGAG